MACTSTVQEKGSDQPHNASGALDKVIVMMADNIEHVCNKAIAGVILKNGYNLKKTMEKTAEQSSSRSFNALDMLGISKMSDILCREHNNYEQEPTMNSHMMNLQRQLAGLWTQNRSNTTRWGLCLQEHHYQKEPVITTA